MRKQLAVKECEFLIFLEGSKEFARRGLLAPLPLGAPLGVFHNILFRDNYGQQGTLRLPQTQTQSLLNVPLCLFFSLQIFVGFNKFRPPAYNGKYPAYQFENDVVGDNIKMFPFGSAAVEVFAHFRVCFQHSKNSRAKLGFQINSPYLAGMCSLVDACSRHEGKWSHADV